MTKHYVHKVAAKELDLYKQEMKAFKSTSGATVTAVGTNNRRIASPSEITSMKIESTDDSNTPKMSNESRTFLKPKSRMTKVEAHSASQQKEATSNVFGSEAYSFHPVPSSYWKKYKKSSKVKGSNRTSSNKMTPQAPYSYGKRNMTAQHHKSFTSSTSSKRDMQGGINLKMCNLEKDIDSFMSQIEQDQKYGIKDPAPMNEPAMISPSNGHSDKVEITQDDALGLMEALSRGDSNE